MMRCVKMVVLILLVESWKFRVLGVEASSEGKDVEDTLIQAQVIFRHGDRTPLHSFPTNPVNISKEWPIGRGQLTTLGKKESFRLGQSLRKRYSKLLKTNYNHEEIFTLSSAYERTIMSAQSLLAGLYESREKIAPWDPIPVRSIPLGHDNILAFSAECRKYSERMECFNSHGIGKDYDNRNLKLYSYLANHTGIPLKEINYDIVSDLFDTLFIQDLNKLKVPEWSKVPIDKETPYLMLHAAEFSFLAQVHDRLSMQLRAGPILKQIIHNMDSKHYKVQLYSGHDTTLATILQSLGVYNGRIPPYSAAIMIELHRRQFPGRKDAENSTSLRMVEPLEYIKVFYKNCTATDFAHALPIPECQDVKPLKEDESIYHVPGWCSVNRLKQLKKYIYAQDWEKLCIAKRISCSRCAYESSGFFDFVGEFFGVLKEHRKSCRMK